MSNLKTPKIENIKILIKYCRLNKAKNICNLEGEFMAHFAIYCLPNDVKHFILEEGFF